MGKPIPETTLLTGQYWDQIQQQKLCVQRCHACEKYIFYPKAWCPDCMGVELEWVELSGKGEVFAFSVVHQAPIESYRGDVPYILAIIKLVEGPQMMANIIECHPDQIDIGRKVEAVFEERDGFFVPQFTVIALSKDS